MSHPRVAAIIPAYNEEETIAGVVSAARACPSVGEVIVISDGSDDATATLAEAAGARVFQLPHKGGKGQAMLHGLAQTDASVLLFLDADLIGLTPEHVDRLLAPVVNGSLVMAAGLRDRGPVFSRLMRRLPLIGGERAMLRRVIEGIDPKFLQGFMIESALNYHCRANGWSYGSVFLSGLTIRRKYEKVGFLRGMVEYAKMWKQVARAMLLVRIARARKRFPTAYADRTQDR